MNSGKTLRLIYSAAVLSGMLTLAIYFYPVISDAWNGYVASQLITGYMEDVQQTADYGRVLADADAYNARLFAEGTNHIHEYTERLGAEDQEMETSATSFERQSVLSGEIKHPDAYYESMLNVLNDQMMGYIEIPSIDVSLPIYHYASEEVLSKGIGHLYGTSLPVGGNNTHAVLTGHTGLMNARFFTDLDQLKEGDVFTVSVPGRDAHYQVDQIRIVLPGEMDELSIEPGKDRCTLVTCTPYGINTHRLLVRGQRVDEAVYAKQQAQEKTLARQVQKQIHFPVFIFALCALTVFGGTVIIIRIWTKS